MLFFESYGLKAIKIPSNVTKIEEYTFQYCTGLKSFQLYFMAPPYASVAYNISRSECIIYVPYEALNTYKMTSGWKDFLNILPISGDISEPTDIALETGETIKLYLSKGKAMIVDAPMGSVISVYSNTGAMLKTLTVNDIATTIELPTDNIYIIKVGTKVFKVKV